MGLHENELSVVCARLLVPVYVRMITITRLHVQVVLPFKIICVSVCACAHNEFVDMREGK